MIIAEAGVNHNGSLRIAKKLISDAKKCGADAVKFQTFKADDLSTKESSYYKILKDLELDYKYFEELSDYYREKYGNDLRKRYEGLGLDPANLVGKPVYKEGKFTHVKGLGWVIPEYNRAQISMNLTNYKISPLHEIFDIA